MRSMLILSLMEAHSSFHVPYRLTYFLFWELILFKLSRFCGHTIVLACASEKKIQEKTTVGIPGQWRRSHTTLKCVHSATKPSSGISLFLFIYSFTYFISFIEKTKTDTYVLCEHFSEIDRWASVCTYVHTYAGLAIHFAYSTLLLQTWTRRSNHRP